MARDVPPLHLAVLVSGEGTTLEALARAIREGRLGATIDLVVSDREEARALERAAHWGLDRAVIPPPPRGPPEWEDLVAEALEGAGAELVVLAGYRRVLKGPVLRRFPGRIVNVHPSLLPRFGGPGMYGLRVAQAVLASGDTVTGATVHVVTADLDHGPILDQESWPVRPDDTPQSLSDRQRPWEHELLLRVLSRVARGELPLPLPARGSPEPQASSASGVDRGGSENSTR